MQPADYGPFDYLPINERPRLTWPGGANLAVWVIPNLEFFPLSRGLSGHAFEAKGKPPTVRPWAQRDYGNRVGIWRIIEVLDKLGIRATASLNAELCAHHPQIVRAGVERGWEFIGHNLTNTVRLTDSRRSIGARDNRKLRRNHRKGIRPPTDRLAGSWTRGDLAHARPSRRRGLSIRCGLDQ